MAKKVHITKLEEAEVEVGVQLRDSSPASGLENRVFIDNATGEMKAFLNGSDVHLSFDQYEVDPANPAEKQVWLNTSSKQLKWRFGGVTQSVSLDDALKVPSQSTTSEYIATLTEKELGNLVDVSTQFPNYLIDAFTGAVENSVYTNVEEKDSALKVVDGQTSGTYELERRVSPAYNYSEGIAVIKSQGLRPKTITDNTDGTHDIVFEGDVTDVLAVNSKVLAYDQEIDIQNRIKAFYLLDGDLNPAVLEVQGINYSSVDEETTVTITDLDLDLTLGFTPSEYADSVRFKPLNLSVEASSDGSLGVMTELELTEIESLNSLNAVLGDDAFSKITAELTNSKVQYIRLNHSPNKENWIIQALIRSVDTGRTAPVVRMWYSTDGLNTLNFIDNWVGYVSASSNDQDLDPVSYANLGYASYFSKNDIKINDDGRYFFNYAYYNPSDSWTKILYFGDLDRADKTPKLFDSSFGGYQGVIGRSNSDTFFGGTCDVDWDNNLVIVLCGQSNENLFIFMYEVDWINNVTFTRSYYYAGTDWKETNREGLGFIKEFEGEKQFFSISENGTNGYLYSSKWRYLRFVQEADAGELSGSLGKRGDTQDVGSTTSPIDGDRYAGSSFSNSVEGGNRFETSSYFHQFNYPDIIDWDFDQDDDTLLILHSDSNNQGIFLTGIDFGRTTYGKPNETDLTFDLVPDAGSFTIDVFDNLSSTTETTSPIPYTGDANTVQSALESLTFIGAGNVEVTGDYTSGFEIRLSVDRRQEMNFSINSNTLDQSGTSVNITVTTLEAGFQPVWLRHDDHTVNTELYNPANGLCLKLQDTERWIDPRYVTGGNLDQWQMSRYHGQVMKVRGKSVLIHCNTVETSNNLDTTLPTLFKIPDYTQCFGTGTSDERKSQAGSLANAYIQHKSTFTTEDDTGTRLAQRWNTGSNPFTGLYLDGQIPLRTLMLYWCIDSLTDPNDSLLKKPSLDSHQIRIRVLPLGTNGEPDWDNPIDISKPERLSNAPSSGNLKYMPFVFENLKLSANTDYFFGIEIVGLDLESDTILNSEDLFAFRFGSRDLTTTNTCFTYKPDQGGWTSANEEIWFQWFDFYMMHTYEHHESGFNSAARAYNIHPADNAINVSYADISLFPLGDLDTSKNYISTYRMMGRTNNNRDTDSYVKGPSHTFSFEIDDTGGDEQLPVIKDAQILAWNDSTDYDRYLVVASALGRDDFTAKRNEDGSRYLYSTDTKDTDYNAQTHFGGYDFINNSDLLRRKEFTGNTHGVEDDPDFLYGTCVHFNDANRIVLRPDSGEMAPFHHDFIFEMEYKPDIQDLQSAQKMLFAGSDLWGLEVRLGRYLIYVEYNGQTREIFFDELIQNVYQRVRVTRDWDNGIRLFVNYSSTGGTWVEFTSSGFNSSKTGDLFKHGASIGDDGESGDFGVGGWSENTSYNIFGRIGYFKMAIGTTQFSYEGLNFNQRSTHDIINKGDIILARKALSVGDHNVDQLAVSEFGIAKHDVLSAKAKTNYAVLRYKNSIASGRKIASKLNLSKVSDNDPSAVEGYLLSYYKK